MKKSNRDHSTLTSSSSSSSSCCPFASTSKSSKCNEDGSTVSSSGCPYALPLQNSDNDEFSSSAVSSSADSMSSTSLLSIKECPLFANHSCPFKDAKSSDEVSEIFTKILPRSHMNEARPVHTILIETLANVHRDQALEGYSVGAIVTDLVQRRQELLELDKKDEDDENHSNHDTGDEPPPQSRRQSRRLSDALKYGTEEAHREAENVHFVKNFIRGKIDRGLYGLFVAQLFHVYKSLERALDEHAPNYFANCHFPTELNRSSALKDDIDFWGDGRVPPVSPATQDYIDRIEVIAKERPILLLAHAYTRYLGDLSGGKILARVAKRALLLDSGPEGRTEGLAFYDFPLLRGSVKAFKDQYRQALNDLHFEDEIVEAVVQEANVAFLLNMRLFEELDVIGSVPEAKVRPIEDVYSCYTTSSGALNNSISATNENEGEDEDEKTCSPCPFLTSSTNTRTSMVLERHQNVHKCSGKTCPWPFILLHDPKAGMRKWQTWIIIGLALAYLYQNYITSL